jgi:hypothetical protein
VINTALFARVCSTLSDIADPNAQKGVISDLLDLVHELICQRVAAKSRTLLALACYVA